MVDKDKLKAQLEALRKNFIEQLPKRLDALENGLQRWRQSLDEVELAEFHRTAHSLTGAGATFGCEELSCVARKLEQQLVSTELARELDVVETLLQQVRQAMQQAGREQVKQEFETPLVTVPQGSPGGRVVYLLEDEEESRKNLAVQLGHFGYKTELFASASELATATRKQRPAAIIADIVLVEGGLAGIDVVKVINAEQAVQVPVIFISARDDFEARLESVRAGGRAYFKKPLSIESLVDMVDELTSVEEVQPYRILIVDDSESQALYYAGLLGQAGMEIEVVTEPEKVMDAIKEFSPELVLMDMYMPYCSGVELAAVIRQQPSYLGLPIVFLSAETDRSIQLDAMSTGGDDFLSKPIKPVNLIKSVSIRAERYRGLGSRMSQDSLTGLLNHRRIMEALSREMARVQRHGGSLSFAMLDIDHFKLVNDNHGHAVGDRVIKGLARLLKQRLRNTDHIGRYGGEEFAVIMPETSLAKAVKVMNEVRQSFAELLHSAGEQTITVTLSAGVAAAPAISNAAELRETADQMLYQAKHKGRNQVVAVDASE